VALSMAPRCIEPACLERALASHSRPRTRRFAARAVRFPATKPAAKPGAKPGGAPALLSHLAWHRRPCPEALGQLLCTGPDSVDVPMPLAALQPMPLAALQPESSSTRHMSSEADRLHGSQIIDRTAERSA
jgi:hypothetical protein